MNDFEKLVDAINRARKAENRKISIRKILGKYFDNKRADELEKELNDLEGAEALYGNDSAFKDYLSRTLKKHI